MAGVCVYMYGLCWAGLNRLMLSFIISYIRSFICLFNIMFIHLIIILHVFRYKCALLKAQLQSHCKMWTKYFAIPVGQGHRITILFRRAVHLSVSTLLLNYDSSQRAVSPVCQYSFAKLRQFSVCSSYVCKYSFAKRPGLQYYLICESFIHHIDT